jgi:hypothetical protein
MKPIAPIKPIKTKNRKRKVTGYILYQTAEYVVIATLKSSNRKTGNMVQIWILYRHLTPVQTIKQGKDGVICFDCPHRGKDGMKQRTCYVTMKAPNGIYRAFINGRYPVLPIEDYGKVFGGRAVRFGAYGEPVLIPMEIMRAIGSVARGWTGYTHQWRNAQYQSYRAFIVASCDSAADYAMARAMGWRTFRVRGTHESLLTGEIMCPASDEAGKRTMCEKCRLCDGTRENDARKNISIIVHGAGSKNFVSIESLLAA